MTVVKLKKNLLYMQKAYRHHVPMAKYSDIPAPPRRHS